jgi:hypothetical protein
VKLPVRLIVPPMTRSPSAFQRAQRVIHLDKGRLGSIEEGSALTAGR